MEGKGVKKVVEAMVLALMLLLLLGAEHSSMAATVDHGNADDDQCIRECLLACPKHDNCDLTCPLRCAVQQPTALTNDDSLDAYCKHSCSIAPQCIRFLRGTCFRMLFSYLLSPHHIFH